MQLQNVKIVNFRALAEIEFKVERDISVIVGPNAIGKTSILEAIRLAKGILAPRFVNEAQTVLHETGAMLAGTNAINFPSLASDPSKALEIVLSFELSTDEIKQLKNEASRFALLHVRNQLGISPINMDDIGLIQYLSSPQGNAVHTQATAEVQNRMSQIERDPKLKLHLIVGPQPGFIRGADLLSQEAISVLEGTLPPTLTLFSYFPADRAMPTGDVAIQIGAADSNAQIQSHMGMPATKYQRLKNFLVNQTLMGPDAQKNLQDDFSLIFDSLIYGKRLKSLAISPHGTLSVLIEDKETGKVFDIDRMSSGEKGLILQFLLMRRSIAKGGLLLIDEPELHLNPAICRQLITFFDDHVLRDRSIKAIICTHSPDILADAFERSDCRLFHLRSPKDISPVYKEDKAEMFEALRRLGAQTSDVLFSKGTIFVEGVHDAELIPSGFSSRVSGFRFNQLRGRAEVEKEIKTLQSTEADGRLNSAHYFVFDRDNLPTTLTSTKYVRVRQWDRYCFENYLLDPDAIFDVCQELKLANPPQSRGSVRPKMKELAFNQIQALVVKEIYSSVEPDNPGLRSHEVQKCVNYQEAAAILFQRLDTIREQLKPVQKAVWIAKLTEKCGRKETEIKAVWEEKWPSECDGKKLLSDLHQFYKVNVSLLEFKKRIIAAMSKRGAEYWRIVDSYLTDLLKVA